MSIFLFRTSKELNSNGYNFVQMSMFFKKYSSFLLSNGIGSKTRLTSFKSQFSHLLGPGLKFGPMKEYINSYQSANNRQSTSFFFFTPDRGWFWSLSFICNNNKKNSK